MKWVNAIFFLVALLSVFGGDLFESIKLNWLIEIFVVGWRGGRDSRMNDDVCSKVAILYALHLHLIVKQILFSFAHLRRIFRNKHKPKHAIDSHSLHSASHFFFALAFISTRILMPLRYSLLFRIKFGVCVCERVRYFFSIIAPVSVRPFFFNRILCGKSAEGFNFSSQSLLLIGILLSNYNVDGLHWVVVLLLACTLCRLEPKYFWYRFVVKCVYYESREEKKKPKRHIHFLLYAFTFYFLLLLHECCFSSIYVARLMVFCGKFMHFRGNGTAINRKPASTP